MPVIRSTSSKTDHFVWRRSARAFAAAALLGMIVLPDRVYSQTPLNERFTDARRLMHAGDFRGATQALQRLTEERPADPAPSVLLGITTLWQTLYDGGNRRLYDLVARYATEGYVRADAQLRTRPDAELFFWRGTSRMLRLAAQLSATTLAQERRAFSFQALMAGAALLRESRAAEADLQEAVKRRPQLKDAIALRVLLASCGAAEQEACVRRLWDVVNELEWLEVEVKYVLVSLVYGRGVPEELSFRAVPLALELSLRFPSNGLFQLAAVKIAYEVGNADSAKSRAAQIADRYREFGQAIASEARYYLGVIAAEQQQWRDALSQFQLIVRLSPEQPEYLLPWSYLRGGQAAAQLGDTSTARALATAAIKGRNVAGVRPLAEALLRELSKRSPGQ